jgi:hypothetical protein
MKIVFDIKDIFANVPMNIALEIVLGETSASVYNWFVTCKVIDSIFVLPMLLNICNYAYV